MEGGGAGCLVVRELRDRDEIVEPKRPVDVRQLAPEAREPVRRCVRPLRRVNVVIPAEENLPGSVTDCLGELSRTDDVDKEDRGEEPARAFALAPQAHRSLLKAGRRSTPRTQPCTVYVDETLSASESAPRARRSELRARRPRTCSESRAIVCASTE